MHKEMKDTKLTLNFDVSVKFCQTLNVNDIENVLLRRNYKPMDISKEYIALYIGK